MITILPSIVRLAKDQNLVVSALLLIEEPTSLDLIATIRGRGAAPGKKMGTATGTGCGGSGGGLPVQSYYLLSSSISPREVSDMMTPYRLPTALRYIHTVRARTIVGTLHITSSFVGTPSAIIF